MKIVYRILLTVLCIVTLICAAVALILTPLYWYITGSSLLKITCDFFQKKVQFICDKIEIENIWEP